MPTRIASAARPAGLLLCALLAACGPGESPSDQADGGSQPRTDAGPGPDAGTEPDAGTPPDGGSPGELVVTSRVSPDPRRGPIELRFTFADPDRDVGSGHRVELLGADESWKPATVTVIEERASGAAYLWDSFADVDSDMRAQLRLVVSDPDGDVTLPFAVEVRNQPDTDRVVAVGHAVAETPDGQGVTDLGTEVSLLLWNGLAPGLIGQPRRIEVGTGPRRISAAPHGRAMAVLESREGTVSILTLPLAADVQGVTVAHALSLPGGSAADVEWSRDGRFLYVLGAKGDNMSAPVVWRFTPSEDLSRFDVVDPVATLPGPPSRFAVGPDGGFLVMCGGGGTGLGKALRYDAQGHELGRLEEDYGPTNGLAISPAGNFAIFTSDLFGYDLRLFSLAGPGLTQVGPAHTNVQAPDQVIFHPASTPTRALALVSNAEKNKVTPIIVTASGLQVGTAATGLPLAMDMDMIERGTQTGTVLVSTVDTLSRVTFGADGTVRSHGAVLDFGEGPGSLNYGVSIQR